MADLEMGHWPKKCMEKITFNTLLSGEIFSDKVLTV